MILKYSIDMLSRPAKKFRIKLLLPDVDHQLSVEELKHFFALDLYMDIVQRAGDVKTYWEKHAVWGDAFAKSIFTRDRFLAIRHNLTWCDTSLESHTR